MAAIVWLAAVGAAAQPTAPGAVHGIPGPGTEGIGDVPAGSATLHVRVVHATDPAAAAGVPLVLYALGADGTPGLRAAAAGDDGTFAFDGISGDPSTVYLVGARYAEVPFGVRASFAPGQQELRVELPIAEPTADASGAGVGDVLVRVDRGCNGLLIRESHELLNDGDRVIYVPPGEREGHEPVLRISVPEGATHLEGGAGEAYDFDGSEIRYWGPLRPGAEEVEFGYALAAGDPTRVTRSFPEGAARVRVFSRAQAPAVSPAGATGPALSPAEPVDLEGVRYAVLEARDVAPGDAVGFTAEPNRAASAAALERLSAVESRVWLDADGAALTVDEQHRFAVSGDSPLASASGEPLFCLEVGADAEQLQFSTESLALGLSRDPSGAVGVAGPIPPGESGFAMRYRVPVAADAVRYAQTLPFDVPLLSVLIADNGWVVETDRLHRRRPARTSDRTYLYLEGFGIEAGSPVQLTLHPIPARGTSTPLGATGFAVAAALVAIGFLTVPLRGAGPAGEAARAPDPIEEERQSVLAALRSLEDDYDTGKVSEADYDQLRGELRASAVALARSQRDAATAPAPAAARPEPACGKCGAALAADARFCSQCGAPVAPEAESGSAA